MPNHLDDFFFKQKPTPERPLQGQTVLVVEDSRFASEAMRLMCLRSGARVRRADSLESAARHLATYRPGIAVVDLGLPDGSGLGLISELKSATPPVAVVLAISGDPLLEEEAVAAGADTFLAKPLDSLSVFLSAVLTGLPEGARPKGPWAMAEDHVAPDALAYQDDLARVAEEIDAAISPEQISYLAKFLTGIARSAGDTALAEAGQRLTRRAGGPEARKVIGEISDLVVQRLEERAVV